MSTRRTPIGTDDTGHSARDRARAARRDIARLTAQIRRTEFDLAGKQAELAISQAELTTARIELTAARTTLRQTQGELDDTRSRLAAANILLEEQSRILGELGIQNRDDATRLAGVHHVAVPMHTVMTMSDNGTSSQERRPAFDREQRIADLVDRPMIEQQLMHEYGVTREDVGRMYDSLDADRRLRLLDGARIRELDATTGMYYVRPRRRR
ncbi:hypothetical protein BDZ85DRAFT_314044 [Elsinoe ampelina]|uniref:Uncharacterized protein n=1 Tax=Elsinoe ampelina TaxID=302913 RepID=A0A6A6G7T1_9PEZI|nr:hypothetical protein BDZ85DRAFT_314044 [Elsinoe ampelina]